MKTSLMLLLKKNTAVLNGLTELPNPAEAVTESCISTWNSQGAQGAHCRIMALSWTRLDRDGQGWTGLGRDGQRWTGMDRAVLPPKDPQCSEEDAAETSLSK